MKNSLNILILSICLLAGINKAGAGATRFPDSSVCLEIEGRIVNAGEGDSKTLVTVLRLGSTRDTIVLKNGQRKFRTYFLKNTSYTVTVSKAGYYSKVIIIDTKLGWQDEKLYRFYFDATMEPQSADASVFVRQEHNPVALIYFDKKKECFYYNKFCRALAINQPAR
jgi:hypothetical protein